MWIIPNNLKTSSAFVADTLELSEDLSLPGLKLEHSLMWRSKPTPLPTWLRRWKRVPWFRHLSGRILKPSHHTYFETRLASSLAAIPASRSAQQERGLGKMTPDTYGLGSENISKQSDLFGASLKTSRDTSPSDSEKLSKTWKDLVTQRRGEYSARLKSARLIRESEFTSWPTPTVQDSNKATKVMRDDHQNNLTALVFHREEFPTPTARDWKGGYTEAALTRKDGKSRRFDALPNAAIGGVGTDIKAGHLNPNWVEWLMGVPTGWTDLGFWETE